MGAARWLRQRCRLKLFPPRKPAPRHAQETRSNRSQYAPFHSAQLGCQMRVKICFGRSADREDDNETHTLVVFVDVGCGVGNALTGELGAGGESSEHYGEIALDAVQQEPGGSRGVP